MSEVRPIYDDELDLFEFFEMLWEGKWLISAFGVMALLFGGVFLLLKAPVYESKLIYSMDVIPPFYEKNKASTDFKKKFYSVSLFKEWKKNNSDASIVFEDLSATKVVDGFVISKNEYEQLATLASEKGDSFVLIKSNQLPVLDDFFEYANHISGLLNDEYVIRAKEELKIIDKRYKDLDSSNSNIINTVLSIDRYIVTAEKEAKVLAIQRPTMPKKVSPKPFLVLAMSLVLGGVVGVFFILIRNATTKRKERLAKVQENL